MVQWPDFTLPPINLWNVPHQEIWGRIQKERVPSYEKPAVRINKAEILRQLLQAR